MAPAFDALWGAHQADLDRAFSEAFALIPRALPPVPGGGGLTDVNARTVASTTRPQIPFVGTFVDAGAQLHAHGRTKADTATHTVGAERPMIDVAQGALPHRPEVGDHIHRIATDELFTVQMYLPEAPVRAWIYLADATIRTVSPR